MPNRYLITHKGYDNIGGVLDQLGEGFGYDQINLGDVTLQKLKQYQVFFINCAGEASNIKPKIASIIREYVEAGGSIYASDYGGGVLKAAFPEIVKFDTAGSTGHVTCRVKDEGLATEIGQEIDIHFDMGSWWRILDIHRSVRVYLETRDRIKGKTMPIVVTFQSGRGHVIYTSFHNSAQTSAAEKKLLRFLALRPIMAESAQSAVATLTAQNAIPGREIISMLSKGKSSEPYQYAAQGNEYLLFVLHWTGSGASLRLVVRDGKGKVVATQQGDKPPLQLEIPPAADSFTCHIEADKLPHDNFPFVLTLATRKAGGQAQAKALPKAPPPPPIAAVTPTSQWLFYLLIDCSSAAAQHGSAIAQGVSAIVKTLRSTPINGITPAVAFGESRQMNAAMRSPLPLTQNANLNLATSGDTTLVPVLTQLIAELEKPRSATALGKPLVVVVLVGEPRDEYEPLAQRVQQMAAGGQLNLFAVGIGDAVSGTTLRKVARIALRVSDPQSGAVGGCFDWLGQVGLHMMRSLQGGGAGQTINLPPIPAGVQQL